MCVCVCVCVCVLKKKKKKEAWNLDKAGKKMTTVDKAWMSEIQ